MPSPYVLKDNRPDSFYHIYVRGAINHLFPEATDYDSLMGLIGRYFAEEPVRNTAGIAYSKLTGRLDILGYIFLDNEIHLLVFQREPGSMQRLMRGILTGYSRYFNTKYGRRGGLFVGRYRANRLSNEPVALQVSRYLHRLPPDWRHHAHSSLSTYDGSAVTPWVASQLFKDTFGGSEAYLRFVADGEAAERSLARFKDELAL